MFRIKKTPVVVNDGPGFLVNRLLFPYMNEAVQLLVEGGDMQAIDRAAKDLAGIKVQRNLDPLAILHVFEIFLEECCE